MPAKFRNTEECPHKSTHIDAQGVETCEKCHVIVKVWELKTLSETEQQVKEKLCPPKLTP